MKKLNATVIVPENLKGIVEEHEIETAWIIAQHYNQVVEFLKPIDDYQRKTPDIVMGGQLWEMKSPIGKSKRNIERQLKRALKQSRNIIIDGRRSDFADDIIEKNLRYEAKLRQSIRKLVFITKSKKIVEIIWK
jgi:hypothetical protein